MRRTSLIRGVASMALVAALSVLLQPVTPAGAADQTFQAATLNILNSLGHDDFVHDLELITSKADLVGLNEVASRKDFLQTWADDHGWWLYAPEPNDASNEALLAKKSMFDVLDQGKVFACDTNGDNEVPPARYTTWVKYRHKASGRVVFHINLHANSSIEDNGRPVAIPRTQCAEKQFQDVKALAQQKKDDGQVIVSGDLNIDFSADRAYGDARFPWKVFEANQLPNLRSVYNLYGEKGTGTHGNRHIDYIYFWKRVPDFQVMWMTDYRIVTGTRSDHNGVVADFSISQS